ncbi:PucR family transcriptional regulator [Streptomyces sp. NPDC052107]|uniref:PucR family transcriptional regulator n=1 Tax=Streptomyces sp. NPDC052107 TaxID=3155632 RepID=UPI0034254DF6
MSFPESTSGTESSEGTCQVTLRELLGVAELQLQWVLGDHDKMERAVRWAHTTELLDPAPYLRGGELVCTVGASLTHPEACCSFVAAVSGANAAALCFGTGDLHEEIPSALVDACQQRGLPLLHAPKGVPFIRVAEYLSERRVAAEIQENRRAELLMSKLLAAVRAQVPVSGMVAIVAESLRGRVELIVNERTIATEGVDSAAEGVLVTAAVEKRSTLTWSGAGAAPSLTLLGQLGRVIELARHERDVEEALKRERVGQLLLLVEDRLANPIALRPILDETGIDERRLVLSAWPEGAAPLLAAHLADSLIGEAPGIALAVTRTANPAYGAAQMLSLPCGYSSSVELVELPRAIAEARAALKLARRRGGAVGPDALTSLEGLLEQQPARRLSPFIDQILTPLITSDDRHGTSHVETLRTFLRLGGSLQETAREQYLHVNTVRHRLARIHLITGHDPLVFADRVALAIALWAYDRRQTGQNRAM